MVRRKKPENWTPEEKEIEIKNRVEYCRKAMGLFEWDVTCTFDLESEEILASTESKADYNRATINFNSKWLGDWFLLKEKLDGTVIHELVHILNAQFHRVYLDLRGTYIQTIRHFTNDRWRNISERTTVNLTNTLKKENLQNRGAV